MGPYTSRGFCQSRRKRLSKSLIPVRQNDVLGNSLPLTVDIAEGRGGVLNLEPIPQCPVGDDEAHIQVLASAYPLVASDGQSTYLCVGDVLESGNSSWTRAMQEAAHRQGVELYLTTSDEEIARARR
jgi:hypothetical protein